MLLYNWKAYLEPTTDRKCKTVCSLLASMNLTFPQVLNFYLWLTEQQQLQLQNLQANPFSCCRGVRPCTKSDACKGYEVVEKKKYIPLASLVFKKKPDHTTPKRTLLPSISHHWSDNGHCFQSSTQLQSVPTSHSSGISQTSLKS